MSKRINVNPDHYKVRGRERPGKDVARPPAGSGNRQMPMGPAARRSSVPGRSGSAQDKSRSK